MKVYSGSQVSYINKSPSPQETLAANTESEDVQLELAGHSNMKVRATLAEFNRDLTMDVVEILINDQSRMVRSALARNPHLSEDAQLLIAEQRK